MDEADSDDTRIQLTHPNARSRHNDKPESEAARSVERDQKKFSRTGFLTEGISVPEDFDVMGANDIEEIFGPGLRAL